MTDSANRDDIAAEIRAELPAIEANNRALTAMLQSLLGPSVIAALTTAGASAPATEATSADALATAREATILLSRVDARLAELRATTTS